MGGISFSKHPALSPNTSLITQARYHSTTPASKPVPKAAQHCTPGTPPSALPKAPAALPSPPCSHAGPRFIPLHRLSLSRDPKNRKTPRIATFLRLGIAAGRQSAANRLIGSQFVLCTDKRESAIAKKLHRRRIICFHNGKITITGRILKRDADKRARIPLAGADGERTPASAATDIGRRCSGAVNGTRLAAQRAAATGGRQQWHRTYTSKSARALQVSMMTRKVRACASKSASGVLTSAGKLKSPWGWPNVPPPWALKFTCAVRTPRSVIAFRMTCAVR